MSHCAQILLEMNADQPIELLWVGYWIIRVEPLRKEVAIVTEKALPGSPTCVYSAQVPIASNADSKPLRHIEFEKTVYTECLKPAFDRLAAFCALIVCAVPMLFVAALIGSTMGHPVLFRQRRCGLDGKVFNVLKFRTMGKDRRVRKACVLDEQRVTHKSDVDPRHTSVGKVLRRYSIDELPQLINVLRGDMSIVGPRPELESVVRGNYPVKLKQRHFVRPGLTGLWQISARGDGPMHENGEWDLEYVERISLLTDLEIICKTPFAMFGANRGN